MPKQNQSPAMRKENMFVVYSRIGGINTGFGSKPNWHRECTVQVVCVSACGHMYYGNCKGSAYAIIIFCTGIMFNIGIEEIRLWL